MENLDVYGVCNPLIDLLSHVPDSFLTERGLNKNSMNLITLEEQQTFLMALAAGKISVEFAAGGSGANTMIGIAQLEDEQLLAVKLAGMSMERFTGKNWKTSESMLYLEKETVPQEAA